MGRKKDDTNIDWKSVDWRNKTTTQIAQEHNATFGCVSARRKKHAPETVRNYKFTDWMSVDWRTPTKDLVEKLGVEQSIVSKKRKALAPETSEYRIPLKERLKKVDWLKPSSQIAEEENTTIYEVSRFRKMLAPETVGKTRRKKYRNGLSK